MKYEIASEEIAVPNVGAGSQPSSAPDFTTSLHVPTNALLGYPARGVCVFLSLRSFASSDPSRVGLYQADLNQTGLNQAGLDRADLNPKEFRDV